MDDLLLDEAGGVATITLNRPERLNAISDTMIFGLANVLGHLAPLHLMCDPLDIRVVPQVKDVHNKKPTIYFYDRYPGGIGLSQRLYELHEELLREAERLIRGCGCQSGCPACVGPIEEVGLLGKDLALSLLEGLRTPS